MKKAHAKAVSGANQTVLEKNYAPISKSWNSTVGLLKGKKKALETHIKNMRKEWNG